MLEIVHYTIECSAGIFHSTYYSDIHRSSLRTRSVSDQKIPNDEIQYRLKASERKDFVQRKYTL